ncbi:MULTISPECIES: hypothetical protein [Bacillus cereus group]|uniref:hypothetical protein n=1 Tax=Bacillus cereus group TaxID=86661 RepID=UPI000BFCD24E|nr:hypothetical protein [Bacillus cereus]MBJ8005030.1 hypothetical protein [Bacillus cereus]
MPRQATRGVFEGYQNDYGLGLIRSFTASFRFEIARRCHGRALPDVVREYDIPYTTLETCIEKIRYCY